MNHRSTRPNRLRGFTLIELMIVVAILGILAAIAIPMLASQQLRSKATEAKTNLGAIRVVEEANFGETGEYLAADAEPAVIPGATTADFDVAGSDFAALGWSPEAYFSYAVTVAPDASGYTADAAADLDENGVVRSGATEGSGRRELRRRRPRLRPHDALSRGPRLLHREPNRLLGTGPHAPHGVRPGSRMSAETNPSLEPIQDELLGPRLDRLHGLRSAWAVLAPTSLVDDVDEIGATGRALTRHLSTIAESHSDVSPSALAGIDNLLAEFETSIRHVATQLPVAQLRSALPCARDEDRAGLNDLLDVLIARGPADDFGLDERIGAGDYLVTLLGTQGAERGSVRFDPVTLTEPLEPLRRTARGRSAPRRDRG